MTQISNLWLYITLIVFTNCENNKDNYDYDYSNSTDPQVIWQIYKTSSGKVYKSIEEDNMR